MVVSKYPVPGSSGAAVFSGYIATAEPRRSGPSECRTGIFRMIKETRDAPHWICGIGRLSNAITGQLESNDAYSHLSSKRRQNGNQRFVGGRLMRQDTAKNTWIDRAVCGRYSIRGGGKEGAHSMCTLQSNVG